MLGEGNRRAITFFEGQRRATDDCIILQRTFKGLCDTSIHRALSSNLHFLFKGSSKSTRSHVLSEWHLLSSQRRISCSARAFYQLLYCMSAHSLPCPQSEKGERRYPFIKFHEVQESSTRYMLKMGLPVVLVLAFAAPRSVAERQRSGMKWRWWGQERVAFRALIHQLDRVQSTFIYIQN